MKTTTLLLLLPWLLALVGASTVQLENRAAGDDAHRTASHHRERDAPFPPRLESAKKWFREGAVAAGERGASQARASNLILFVGDGMSLTTVAAARIFEGQRRGESGEENRLAWEDFPATALVKTYNTDSQTPDSAGTMTAMTTGAKTRRGLIGLAQSAVRGSCKSARGQRLLTLWELGATTGFATGLVTTTRLTHATPAATFAHTPERDWESDADVPAQASREGCIDIARQMIESEHGSGADVMMGGGRSYFLPVERADPEYSNLRGRRTDKRDLVAHWKKRHPSGQFVWNAQQFEGAKAGTPLLALFEPDHMHFEHDRAQDVAGEPSLAEMTRSALQRLQAIARARGTNAGYVLLVEGGRIDHAHHYGNAYRALRDTVAFSDAVRVADTLTSSADTLILVTADHSHTLTFAGYPVRGNPILGKVRGASGEEKATGPFALDALGLPYTTLSYANGPGYPGATTQQPEGPKRYKHTNRGAFPISRKRSDLGAHDTQAPDYLQESTLPLEDETHGGDDVGLWARGPGSAAVRGSLEQNAIFHLMLQANPRLRRRLCESDYCDERGLPIKLPLPKEF